jgi:hypothetical protein
VAEVVATRERSRTCIITYYNSLNHLHRLSIVAAELSAVTIVSIVFSGRCLPFVRRFRSSRMPTARYSAPPPRALTKAAILRARGCPAVLRCHQCGGRLTPWHAPAAFHLMETRVPFISLSVRPCLPSQQPAYLPHISTGDSSRAHTTTTIVMTGQPYKPPPRLHAAPLHSPES